MTPVLTDLGAEAPSINRFIKELGPFSQAGIPALPVARRRRRRRGPGADQEQADHHRHRPARVERQAADQQPGLAADLAEGHRRHRAPDGLPLLPGGRHQRLRCRRALPARRPDPQRLLAVRDRGLARLPGDVRQLQQRRSARAASATTVPGYADTRRSPSLRKLDAYFHGKTLDLGGDAPPSAQGDSGSRRPPRAPRAPAAPAAAPAAPRRQPAAPSQPQASGDDPASALLDYLLGGDG